MTIHLARGTGYTTVCGRIVRPGILLTFDRIGATCKKCLARSLTMIQGGRTDNTMRPIVAYMASAIIFEYTNYQGIKSTRRVLPERMEWKATPWHPTPQWLLTGYDLDKGEVRSFAMQDMNNVRDMIPAPPPYEPTTPNDEPDDEPTNPT